jgi:DNA mismatch endonuclease (patch repair protein)
MADIVDAATRSRMMSGIRGKDTAPEMQVRRFLHEQGFRYRLHRKDLPGVPDIVLPKYHAVIFVHGCFWHGHDCKYFKPPATRSEFWASKIARNRQNDKKSKEALLQGGWRVAIIWECALRGKAARKQIPGLARRLTSWIRNSTRITFEAKENR